MKHRKLHFKIELLDSDDNFLEEKSLSLLDGQVNVNYSDISRRTCSFTLREPLPDDWMRSRWKMYYGVEQNGTIDFAPLGVFIPEDPEESERLSEYETQYSGRDKACLLEHAYSDIPLDFTQGTSLKEVAQTIFALIGETKLNLEDVPYTLQNDFSFEEGISLEHILSTLVRSFPADWYYDPDGIATLAALPPANERPITFIFDEGDDGILIDSSRSFDSEKYWNRVILVGGTVDTGIFRQTYGSDVQRQVAGRWKTKFFKEDTATSQEQVNELTWQLLDAGLRLPASITIHNLPLARLDTKQIVMYKNVRYEVIDFNIPLDLGIQTIEAGEVLVA